MTIIFPPDYFRSCFEISQKLGVYTFQNCSKLEITNEQLKIVKTIGESGFNNCTKIVGEISIPNIESIGSTAFAYTSITSIDLTGTPIAEISSYAFSKMSALKKEHQPRFRI